MTPRDLLAATLGFAVCWRDVSVYTPGLGVTGTALDVSYDGPSDEVASSSWPFSVDATGFTVYYALIRPSAFARRGAS